MFKTLQGYFPEGGDERQVSKTKRSYPTWDINGDTVLTDLSLWSYATWTIDLIEHLREVVKLPTRMVNATEGGILGTTLEPGRLNDCIEYKRLGDLIDELEVSNTSAHAVGPEMSRAPDSRDGAIAAAV